MTDDVATLHTYASGDPFAFLVVEQVVKEKARSRVPDIKPHQMFFGSKRHSYQAALDSYRELEDTCNVLWNSLCLRLMKVQVDITLLPFEKALQRAVRAEQHQDDLQELVYQEELRLKAQQLKGDISQEEYQRQLLLAYQMRFPDIYAQALQEREASRLMNLATLEHQRQFFEQITKAEAKLHQTHEVRMAQLEQEFQIRLVQATPDKADPDYIAQRQREAFTVYSNMIKAVMENTRLTNEEKRRDVNLIIKMAAK